MADGIPIEQRGYGNPQALASTDWVAAHLDDPDARIVESNEDPLVYPSGHIPGAVEIDWTRDLSDHLRRDYIDGERFAALLGRLGISPETTVVFYGDSHNWWAAYAYWAFQLFGHTKARLLDGGRRKWLQEGRPLTRELPVFEVVDYPVPLRDDSTVRVLRDQVLEHVRRAGKLIDVRSPEEFTGERLHMPGYPNEGALRAGHIPGAVSVPWGSAVNENGTFKTAEQLRTIYTDEHGLDADEDYIVYCRIGERSSHSWFVLTQLMGFERVRNYDGSWTEWGNSVGLPIER